ncbi:hypothetical protein D3C77_565590 [compost metagenome]
MKFHAYILCSRYGEEAERRDSVISERSIGCVMYYNDVVFGRPFHYFCKKINCRAGPGRIVWIIQIQQLSSVRNAFRNRIQVRQKFIFFRKGCIIHFPT